MTAGDRIRERREALGWSQDRLAQEMGYKSRSSSNELENSGDNLTLKRIEKAAKALGCSREYLLGWTTLDGKPILNYGGEGIKNIVVNNDSYEISESGSYSLSTLSEDEQEMLKAYREASMAQRIRAIKALVKED